MINALQASISQTASHPAYRLTAAAAVMKLYTYQRSRTRYRFLFNQSTRTLMSE